MTTPKISVSKQTESFGLTKMRKIRVNATTILPMAYIQAAIAIAWGVWVGNPFWSVFEIADAYKAFRILPEWTWGLIAVLIGFYQILAQSKLSSKYQCMAALLTGGFWIFVTVAFWHGNYRSTASVIYPFLIVAAWRDYLRLSWNNKTPAG